MTFSHHTAFLPTFREELEFGFAVDMFGHSDKSDSGLILSCSDDRLRTLNPSFRSYSHLHPHEHRYFSKPPFFKVCNISMHVFHVILLRNCSGLYYHNVCISTCFNLTQHLNQMLCQHGTQYSISLTLVQL